MSELDALDPLPQEFKLQNGAVIEFESLRARQFFKLLRIITHSAVPAMRDLFALDPNEDQQKFVTTLLTVVVLSIPDAEDETIEFLNSMVKPVGLIEGRRLNKGDSERNEELWRQVDEEMDNPHLEDLVGLVEAIVRREAADIQALGKRVAAMFKLAEKTGQTRNLKSPSPTTETNTSSAGSLGPSTSSRASTGGRTRRSRTSRSGDSVNVSPQSENDASTASGSESSS